MEDSRPEVRMYSTERAVHLGVYLLISENNYHDEKEYEEKCEDYSRLGDIVQDLLVHQLHDRNIKFSGIKRRVKKFNSFREKCLRKGYEEPFSQCTDILGLRVIVYLESDIDKVETLIGGLLSIDHQDSVDKRKPDRNQEFGYRSLHLICKLGDSRKSLPEYESIFDLRFEIQIRTALQDTWAEIEHTFNYKSQEALPQDLERKLFGASAVLETVDATLSQVTADASKYFNDVSQGSKEQQSDSLTKIGMLALVEKHARATGVENVPKDLEKAASNENAQKELRQFGVETLAEFEELLNGVKPESYLKYASTRKLVMPIQYIRTAMILSDPKKFFSTVDTTTLTSVRPKMVEWLKEERPDIDFDALLQENNIPIEEK